MEYKLNARYFAEGRPEGIRTVIDQRDIFPWSTNDKQEADAMCDALNRAAAMYNFKVVPIQDQYCIIVDGSEVEGEDPILEKFRIDF